ncbi:MAG: DNA-processing protein DprA [Bacteroidales bacterium]|nr:DNA-processing protein DprA [Bacteroidales bacterium]
MNELTYWITLYFMQGITLKRKNEIYVACYKHNPRVSIVQLFEDDLLWPDLGISPEEGVLLSAARVELPNNSFLVENLLSQGFDIIPMDNPEYSRTLRDNLKTITPSVVFTKGNKSLLNEPAVAIVGSRSADSVSLQFTADIARKCVSEGKVVVSGFAKGVDRMALDAALEAGGKSIIVLPQGIATFSSGYKQYYKHLEQGRLLVLSAFYPNAPWSIGFAKSRNSYIYGLSDSIYVARSDDKGGTWSGAIDGLRRKRQIFVRQPESNEKNANLLLIQKGATAVDMKGNPIVMSAENLLTPEEKEKRDRDEKIRKILELGDATTSDILGKMSLKWSVAKMKTYLRNLPFVDEYTEKRKVFFCLKAKSAK